MTRVVLGTELMVMIEPRYPKGKAGHQPFWLEVISPAQLLPQYFGLSDLAMEQAL